ncbi:Tetraspanin/Peripherin [Entophlyctis helioformis]|nr:Tetraspanin/Peripherin [Entophlyctis helioformis]
MAVFRTFVKYLGSTWLVVINLCLLLVSVATLFLGASLLQAAKSPAGLAAGTETHAAAGGLGRFNSTLPGMQASSAPFNNLLLSTNTKDIAISLLVFGSFFSLTAISGCFGAMCAISSFLTFYIGAVSIDLLLLLGLGGYSVYRVVAARNDWMALDVADWRRENDPAKDFIQQAFSCCGYLQNDGTAYTGPMRDFSSPSDTVLPSPNPCAASTPTTRVESIMGCHDQGYRFFSQALLALVVIMAVGVVLCAVSLGAANMRRREDALIKRGFRAANRSAKLQSAVHDAGATKEPLMA